MEPAAIVVDDRAPHGLVGEIPAELLGVDPVTGRIGVPAARRDGRLPDLAVFLHRDELAVVGERLLHLGDGRGALGLGDRRGDEDRAGEGEGRGGKAEREGDACERRTDDRLHDVLHGGRRTVKGVRKLSRPFQGLAASSAAPIVVRPFSCSGGRAIAALVLVWSEGPGGRFTSGSRFFPPRDCVSRRSSKRLRGSNLFAPRCDQGGWDASARNGQVDAQVERRPKLALTPRGRCGQDRRTVAC